MFFFISLPLFAQQSLQDSAISMFTFETTYQGFIPGGDLAKRYGFTSTAGGVLGYKLKSNFYFSAGLMTLFGGDVRDVSMLNNLTINGFLIDNQGNFIDVKPTETGLLIPFSFGKIHPLPFSNNKNSGLYWELGPQFIQHRIWFNVPRNRVSYLTKEYQKGYDRLSNGWGIHEGIGYRYFSNNGYVNFLVGLDVSQNFTQSRRSLQFDQGKRDSKTYLDLLYGIHAAWILPLYKVAPDKVYYY